MADNVPVQRAGIRARRRDQRLRRRREAAHDFGEDLQQRGGAQRSCCSCCSRRSGRSTRRQLDNPLLFPTFSDTIERVLRRHHERRAAAARLVLDQGPADGLRRRHVPGRGADRARDHLARRQRPAGNADGDVQSAARDRAAAARADLVRPRQRQPGLRADPFGAVAGGAQHAFRFPVGLADAAHGRAATTD